MRFIYSIFILLFSFAAAGQEADFTALPLTGPALQGITDITGAGDGSGRLFIVEKRGAIRIVQNNAVQAQEFLSITSMVQNSGERGLLGLAFHPAYPDSPYIYVNYVISGTNTSRIARFTVPAATPDNADESTQLVLMEIPAPFSNHKAGDLLFGPDGYLYITTGDGGDGGDPFENAQNFESYLGKILRIDINTTSPPNNYSIPPDNPYLPYTGAGDTLPEIWMNGLRNPWRIAFDAETGDLWIADVGQNLYEEINMIPSGTGAGLNLGWDCREGFHNYEPQNCDTVEMPLTYPVLEYPHNCPCPYGNGQSVTGGFIYRGDQYPDFYGIYIAVDYSSNDVFLIEPTGPGMFNIIGHNGTGNSAVTTFGEDDDGEMYAGNLSGTLYSVTMGTPLPLHWDQFTATPDIKGNRIQWTILTILGIDYFEIHRSLTLDFNNYAVVTKIEADPEKNTYTYLDKYQQLRGVYYRIAANLDDGSVEYSPAARILPVAISKPALVFDFNSDLWHVYLPEFWREGELTIFDLQGRAVYQKLLSARTHIELSPPVAPGIYFIHVDTEKGSWSERIVR